MDEKIPRTCLRLFQEDLTRPRLRMMEGLGDGVDLTGMGAVDHTRD